MLRYITRCNYKNMLYQEIINIMLNSKIMLKLTNIPKVYFQYYF